MPEFSYQGVDKGGKRVEGKLEAPNEGEVRVMLRSQGIRPVRLGKVSLVNQDLGAIVTGSGGRVPLETLVQFTRQLHVMITSGIPLVQAIEILGEQTTHRQLKNILLAVKEKVSGGDFLWQALSAYPKSFSKLYVSLVRAGESSGALDQMLKRLSRYLEDADRLRKIMKSAMMYPVIVTCIGTGVIFIMLSFVIPKFAELLKGSGQELPGPTQFVIDLSTFVTDHFLLILVGGGGFAYLAVKFVNSSEGKAFLHRTFFTFPIFGPLMQKGGTARFTRTLNTLLASGVNLIDALDICKDTVDNAVLEDAASKIRGEVETGKSLGAVMSRLTVFPAMATQMISVGESTGNLDQMLERVADFYEEEVETAVSGLTKLIEPIILVFLGVTVGGLMIAMYLPIFKLAGSAGA